MIYNIFFFFKQKTAYEIVSGDWSSDVCSSDLEHNFGAFTGEICAGMLKEFSVRYVILGHSERRQFQKEPDALIAKKALAAHAASLKPIVCVGETLTEREGGLMEQVLETQVRGSLAGLTGDQMLET